MVTRSWIKAYPAFDVVNTIGGQVGCANLSSYQTLISTMVDLQLAMREQGHTVSGIYSISSANKLLTLALNGVGYLGNDCILIGPCPPFHRATRKQYG